LILKEVKTVVVVAVILHGPLSCLRKRDASLLLLLYFFLFCGVCGRFGFDWSPAYWYFAFFSLGFRIYKKEGTKRRKKSV